jgi:hypothetical protein
MWQLSPSFSDAINWRFDIRARALITASASIGSLTL